MSKTYNKIRSMRSRSAGTMAQYFASYVVDTDITMQVWFYEAFIIKNEIEIRLRDE